MGVFGRSRTANSAVSGPIWPKFVRGFMHDDQNERASMETAFSHYKSMGFFRRFSQLRS